MSDSKIVSLLAAGTEILFGIGCGDHVVGVSHECDYPPRVNRLPRLTRSRVDETADSRQIDEQVRESLAAGAALYEIDVERLAALAPELIVTQAQCDVCAVSLDDVTAATGSHASLSGTRVVALNPVTLEDVIRDIRRVGVAAENEAGADRLITKLRDRISVVARATADIPVAHRPRVLCLEWIDPPMAAGNWMPELIELAGGRQSLAQAGRHSTVTSWTRIVEYDPEAILVTPCGFDLNRTLDESESLRQLPDWSRLAAVQRGRVYAADGNAYFNRSGPRLVDSLEILAHLLHPERIAPLETVTAESTWRQIA